MTESLIRLKLDLVAAVVYCWCLGLVMMGSIIWVRPSGKVELIRG